MKVLLVNPAQDKLVSRMGKIYNRCWPPIDLANSAAFLIQDGHQVELIDANALKITPRMLISQIDDFDLAFISSSSLDRWQCPGIDLNAFLNYVKALKTYNKPTFIMGAHGTVKPKEMLELSGAYGVIRGEPEVTIREICSGKDIRTTKGVAFLENGLLRVNEESSPLDLNQLPIPAYHLLPMSKYHYEVLGPNFNLFEGSRGCAENCDFCLMKMYGRGIRRKNVERIINEIDVSVNQYGVKTAYFMDLEFTILRKSIFQICDYLISRKYDLKWTCQTRFDLIDNPMLSKMKKAGCNLIHFGVEAGSDEQLNRINKRISVLQIEEGMRLVKEADIDSED